MYATVAISGYRSLRDVVLPLGQLTVITGANGAGKSSVYRALGLLAACGRGDVVSSLAAEGGLTSALWAGPESLSGARRGHAVEGTVRSGPVSVRLGVGSADMDPSYLVDLGIPPRSDLTAFNQDPEIKRELIWSGPTMRSATLAARRKRQSVELRDETWVAAPVKLQPWASMLTEVADPVAAPEVWQLRNELSGWRFYDGFRTDRDAPARQPQVGTRTTVLPDDGSGLAAALQTIIEAGGASLDDAVADAFDGARVSVTVADGYFDIAFHQRGMLRALRSAELSDGTLRYLLWLAALMSPTPPPLLVLNEPETSLHPSLIAPLGKAIASAASHSQVIVVTHSPSLIEAIGEHDVTHVELVKDLGETLVAGQGLLSRPAWEWGRR